MKKTELWTQLGHYVLGRAPRFAKYLLTSKNKQQRSTWNKKYNRNSQQRTDTMDE